MSYLLVLPDPPPNYAQCDASSRGEDNFINLSERDKANAHAVCGGSNDSQQHDSGALFLKIFIPS